MDDEVFILSLTLMASVGGIYIYMALATKYQIVDNPNKRSSHHSSVVRGAGIVFPIAAIVGSLVSQLSFSLTLGMGVLAIISFADDIRPVAAGFRLCIHFLGIGLILLAADFFQLPSLAAAACLVVATGILSAFNFMDGINGITGVYGLGVLASFLLIDTLAPAGLQLPVQLMLVMMASLIAFLFFNFRKRALCFAGDVGSVCLAGFLIYLLAIAIYSTRDFRWIGFISIYGIDSVITILFRLERRENIFQPHRTHFYQFLANEYQVPHPWISLAYGALQLLLNTFYMVVLYKTGYLAWFLFMGLQLIVYLVLRTSFTPKRAQP